MIAVVTEIDDIDKAAKALTIDGWTRGPFSVCMISPDGQVGPAEVYGWLRAGFGIWEMAVPAGGMDVVLATLTHVKTGFGLALFTEVESAAVAGDIAIRLADWGQLAMTKDHKITEPSFWGTVRDRLFAAWEAADLVMFARLERNGGLVWSRRIGAPVPTAGNA